MPLSSWQPEVSTSISNLAERHLVNDLLFLVEANYKECHEPSFYSNKLGVSLKRLNRQTGFYYSKTVNQLVQERIHQEAERLLRETLLSAKEIALELGCCDPAHFSRCFKKVTGMSPLNYRRLSAIHKKSKL